MVPPALRANLPTSDTANGKSGTMSLNKLFWIGAGGFLGALARFAVSVAMGRLVGTGLPWGTFAINCSGSFLLGFLATAGTESGILSPGLRVFATVGFLGAYTTFSTWTLETLRLLESGRYVEAVMNVLVSVAAGLLAVATGVACGRLLR